MSNMTELEDAYIDDLRDTFQYMTGFLWLCATLVVDSVILTTFLLLTGLMFSYWSLALHPDKCRIFVGNSGFKWERK